VEKIAGNFLLLELEYQIPTEIRDLLVGNLLLPFELPGAVGWGSYVIKLWCPRVLPQLRKGYGGFPQFQHS